MRRCSRCKTEKPEDQFDWKDRARGKRHSYCKPCKRGYGTDWYVANATAVKERIGRNRQRYLAEARALLWELKDVPCADCGGRFPPYAMDFDHVTGDKVCGISQMVATNVGLARIRVEIAKCEVVCATCHRVRTFSRLGLIDQMLAS